MLKNELKTRIVITVSVLLFLATLSGVAGAVGLTTDQVNLVRNNCTSAKATLNQLHSSDALLRVNSGQIYESLATKMMDKFNERLANNKKPNPAMTQISEKYKSTLDSFRLDYIAYEEQITKAYGIDCTKRPEDFFAAIDMARVKRSVLYSDVAILNQKIEEYKAAIASLKSEYEAAEKVSR